MKTQTEDEAWDDVRVAYQVAKLGTLSAAATTLGIHHTTVIRRISALEERLDTRLFHRHARGYELTESGRDLLDVASKTHHLMNEFAGRVRGKTDALSGELIVTTATSMSSHITPILIDFQRANPKLQIVLHANDRFYRMEYGEAHVALRFGPKPQEPDNVVQPLGRHAMAPFAHRDYVEKYGKIADTDDARNHFFALEVTTQMTKPCQEWAKRFVPESSVVFRASRVKNIVDAIETAAVIGFLPRCEGLSNPNFVQVYPTLPEWEADLWLVTHVHLHRTAKILALSRFLKERI